MYAEGAVHYSGILVITDPGRMNDCAAQIDGLAGVEVRLRYPDDDRLILVQESETTEGQEQGLRAIRAIPGVQLANPVYVMGEDGVRS
jgi:nitrate reductase NapAB chaperone NapD